MKWSEWLATILLLIVVTVAVFAIAIRCNIWRTNYLSARDTCLRCEYPEIQCIGGDSKRCYCIGVRDGQSVSVPVESIECE